MKVLLVAATYKEVKPLLENYGKNISPGLRKYQLEKGNLNVDVLITGVGAVHTVYYMMKTINKKFDLVINVGIAGSFQRELEIGQVVNVTQEEFGDLGIEDRNSFHSLFEKGMMNPNEKPYENGVIQNRFLYPSDMIKELKPVKGLTVNTTHGSYASIKHLMQNFQADIETMEGAAFAYVCTSEGLPWIQLRSISNFVTNRDLAEWDIAGAIESLTEFMIGFIQELAMNS